MPKIDYLKYYWLEDYLFNDVRRKFLKRRFLTVEEFFCIVIWKANRAKTAIKKKLRNRGNLQNSIKRLTQEIFLASSEKKKLDVLLKTWNFSLPMATAILTVLYPNLFTIKDVRVVGQLKIKDFAGSKKYFSEFLPRVKNSIPYLKTLRDKDRYLWGKSFHKSLVSFLEK